MDGSSFLLSTTLTFAQQDAILVARSMVWKPPGYPHRTIKGLPPFSKTA
jgi:hypothetical protein